MNTATTTVVDFNQVNGLSNSPAKLHLELNVSDADTVKELSSRTEGRVRDDYALGALKIGVLSLRHASGQVDADAVKREGDRLMQTMNDSLAAYRTQMTDGVSAVLKDYFDPSDGRFQERVQKLVQKDGELEEVLRRQVGVEGSELARTLAAHLGDSSPLMKLLDPQQSGGLVNSIRNSAEQVLQAEAGKILSEFSLDNKSGALSRMVDELCEKNGKFTGDLANKLDDAVREFSLDKDDSALSRLVRKVEQAQQVGDRDAAAADPAAHLLARESQLLHQGGDGAGLLHGVEVLPRHVLDQRVLERLRVVAFLHHGRELLEARELGGAPAPLPGHELVGAAGQRADQDRLQDAALAQRVGQRLQALLVEALARLVRVGPDDVDGQIAQLCLRLGALLLGCARRKDRGQAAAHAPGASHGQRPPSRARSRRPRRRSAGRGG